MVCLLYQDLLIFSIEFENKTRQFNKILHSPNISLNCLKNSKLFYFSNANSINLSNNSEYETPDASNNFGYILILVKPGIVLISLMII